MEPSDPSAARYQGILKEFNAVSERGDGHFRISLLRVQRYLVLRLEGVVIQTSCVPLMDKLKPVLADRATGDLVVDLSLCEQLNSPALGLIAFMSMEVSRRGGRVFLVKPKPNVASMLKVLGADRTMTVVDSVDQVLDGPGA